MGNDIFTTQRNPMAPREKEPPKAEVLDVRDDLMGEAVAFYGPQSPPRTGAPAGFTHSWRTQQMDLYGSIGVLGLHGGAGASTVTHLLGENALEVGREWPVPLGQTGAQAPLGGVVAVGRDDFRGLKAADVFVKAWAAGNLPGPPLLGLVFVASSPHLTAPRAHESKRILHVVPMGLRLPWMGLWLEGAPNTDALPRRIKQTVKTIKKALTLGEK